MTDLYPLLFEPNIHTALWGREIWLISGHPSSPSVVANGPLAGRKLDELTRVYGRALTGTKAPAPHIFPLLFKIIDAETRLSVQVHPNERTAPLTGGEPKTEMWCVLRDGGSIFAGLKPGATADAVSAAVASGRFEELLAHFDASAGDVFFIPGGLVHAIGDRTLLYEVQQSSDTTYRLYDWARVGKDGKPRELHVEKSLSSIGFDLPVPEKRRKVECPFFRFQPFDLAVPTAVVPDPESFRVYFAAAGSVRVTAGDLAFELETGRVMLLPAGVAARLEPFGPARLFVSSL